MANTGIYDSDFDEAASLRAADDDSDIESLTDAQSPTDGYFEQRNIPRQTFVENPANSPPKAKEAEAEAARAPVLAPSQSQSQSQLPSHPSRSLDEAVTPLLDAGPAPPDYASATAGQREQQRAAFNSEHPLVRNGLLHEHGVFNARDGPQSMRDPVIAPSQLPVAPGGLPADRDQAQIEEQSPNERTGLLSSIRRGRSKRYSDSSRSRGLKGCIATAVAILLIVLAILVATKANLSGASPDQRHNPTFSPGLPPKGPTPSHPTNSNGVPLNSYSPTQSFEFSGSNKFELLELIDYTQYRQWFPRGARISGTVRISPAVKKDDNENDEKPDIQVWVNIATNSPIVVPEVGYIQSAETLEIRFPTPELHGWQLSDNACFDIAVAVHVRDGVSLDIFDVSTVNMRVVVDDGIFQSDSSSSGLTIRESSLIHTTHGGIDVKFWDSRQTVVETTSGKIEGMFALRDLLRLQSTSGSISAFVEPKDDADTRHPVAAEFIMKSTSGNVHAEFPGAGPETFTSSSSSSINTHRYKDNDKESTIPERDYTTRVETTSGRIEGGYILGREAKFATRSAAIVIGVRPYSSALESCTLWTETTSGNTVLEVGEAYTTALPFTSAFEEGAETETSSKHRRGVLDQMKSRHTSTSGRLELIYPQSWEGYIDAGSTSGGISVRGRDVERCDTGSSRDRDRDRGRDWDWDDWFPWSATRPTGAAPGRGGGGVAGNVGASSYYLKHVQARKGDGSSEVKMHTTSGSIEALFGVEGGRGSGCYRY